MASDIVIPEVWERCKCNPADEPSSRYGRRAEASTARAARLAPTEAAAVSRPRAPAQDSWPIFLHRSAGSGKRGIYSIGWTHWPQREGWSLSRYLWMSRFHLANTSFATNVTAGFVTSAGRAGWLASMAVRPVLHDWPRPPVATRRDRRHPYGLAGLSDTNREICRKGTDFYLRDPELSAGVLSCGGYITTGHSAGRGCYPYPSACLTPSRPWSSSASMAQCMWRQTSAGTAPCRRHRLESWAGCRVWSVADGAATSRVGISCRPSGRRP